MEPIELLKAEHVGIRELKARLSEYVHGKPPVIATDRGRPLKVLLGYREIIGLLEMIKDLTDARLMRVLGGGARAIRKGGEGTPARRSLERLLKA